MTFLMSLSKELRRTVRQNVFGELYTSLFGFGMIVEVKFLKCNG